MFTVDQKVRHSAICSVTYQIPHKRQVGQGEERCQHIQPNTVERDHVNHDEVHVDGADDQDHHPSSDLKHPAGRTNMFKRRNNKIRAISFITLCLMIKINLQSVGELVHERWQTGEG